MVMVGQTGGDFIEQTVCLYGFDGLAACRTVLPNGGADKQLGAEYNILTVNGYANHDRCFPVLSDGCFLDIEKGLEGASFRCHNSKIFNS